MAPGSNLEAYVLGNLALNIDSANKEETFEEHPYTQLKWTGPSAGVFSGNYEGTIRLRFVLLEHKNFFHQGSGLYEIITGNAKSVDSSVLAKYIKATYSESNTKKIAVGEIFIECANNNYTITMFGFMNHCSEETCNILLLPLVASKLSKLKIPDSQQINYKLIDKRALFQILK